MRAWQINNFGLDNLMQIEVSDRPLLPREVRVRLHACSLNYRDLMVIEGLYNPKQSMPLIPVSDGAGVVVEVGDEVTAFKMGDRVCATFSQSWCHGPPNEEAMKTTLGSPLSGMLQTSRIFSEEGLIKFPDYLNFVEAATLPCAAITAFNALMCQSSLKPGSTILLQGTGGVSLFALQFAKALGLECILISSSDDKLAKAKELGAQHLINYKDNPRWDHSALELTSGEGVDAVVEVGGQKTINKAIAATKRGGSIFIIGILSGFDEALDLRPVLMKNLRLQGVFTGPKTVFQAMNRVLEHSRIKPVIDRVFSFDEAKLAFQYFASAQHVGKVCINFS